MRLGFVFGLATLQLMAVYSILLYRKEHLQFEQILQRDFQMRKIPPLGRAGTGDSDLGEAFSQMWLTEALLERR
jgi:hypothetical protein